MSVIDKFISRYTKEFDFYQQAARFAEQELDTALQAAGIRAIVTSRAKSISGLLDKCVKREKKNGPYKNVSKAFDDIVDLAGVRVALYFPGERDEVGKAIHRLFKVHAVKEFPEGAPTEKKRFTGYDAVHYRVRLREQSLADSDRRYAAAKIEVQVASVLMHAWSEVEHDLVYKPLAGELSEDEYAILDQLNGLVIAGEIALERLQKSGEARVASGGRVFSNHFDLAAHLLGRVAKKQDEPISEAGLGRVDLLFDLLSRLEIITPDLLKPYLEELHGNLELRPLAEQIIDALLAEDLSRYETFQQVKNRRDISGLISHESQQFQALGEFISQWAEIELIVGKFAEKRGIRRVALLSRVIEQYELIPPDLMRDFDRCRQIRNHAVHGLDAPPPVVLAKASETLRYIASEIKRRIAELDGGRES